MSASELGDLIFLFRMTEKSFFGRIEFKFTDVNLEGGVNAPQFLKACQSYVAFYDLLGQGILYFYKVVFQILSYLGSKSQKGINTYRDKH